MYFPAPGGCACPILRRGLLRAKIEYNNAINGIVDDVASEGRHHHALLIAHYSSL
jgi:hypothetical protein